jgi:hypothetical protein
MLDNLILGHLLYAFFGVTLATFPITCWGPDSMFSYWTEWGDAGMFFGRALGIWMLVVTTSPWTVGMDKATLAKLYLPINLYITPLFAYVAMYIETSGPGPNALLPVNLWWPQVFISLALLVVNVLVVKDLPKGAGMF